MSNISPLIAIIQKNQKYLVLLVLLVLVTYLNILPNQLFFDDEELIYKNAYVADLGNFPKYFTSNMVEGANKISNMYRPFLITSFAFDHLIWNNNPVGYHLTSIFLHLSNTILIYFFLLILTGNKNVSFISSILFGIHPALSEAVIYASGRTDPLYVFWGLISMISFLLVFQSKKLFYLIYVFSLVCFSISLLVKETAIVVPFLSVIAVFYKHPIKRSLKRLFILIIPFILIILCYILFRLTVLNFSDTLNFYSGLSTDQMTRLYSNNLTVRLFTFTKVFFTYLGILIFPEELAMARTTPVITDIFNPWVFLFFSLNLILFIISGLLFKKNRLSIFLLLWFFISLLPVIGIIPINSIIAEHYLYLPSVSIFLAFSTFLTYLMYKLRKSTISIRLIKLFFVIIVVTLSFRTIARTFDWRNPIIFYTLSLKQDPTNLPMRHNLAMAYQDSGNLELAIKVYTQIISISDLYPQTRHNLGNAYKNLGKYPQAEIEYKKALEIDPNFYFTYYELADLYQKTGEKEKLSKIMAIINNLKTK